MLNPLNGDIAFHLDDVVVNLKDRLRDVRHVIRSSRHDRRRTTMHLQSPAQLPEMLLGTAATFVDTALSVAETISISLISDDPQAHGRSRRIGSLKLYFAHSDGIRLFHRDMYYLTKEVLRRCGRNDVFIHEAAFADIYLRLMRDHKNVFDRAIAPDASTGDLARAGAALAIESVRRHPVRKLEPGSPLPAAVALQSDSEITIFSAIGLACALATTRTQDDALSATGLADAGADLLESAFLAVSAREERFIAAFASNAPESALAELFSLLIPHLP
ncbi:hypothetical protein [Mesorhizobium sp. RMAD-H1]|uniref:hypothetical protein n=1 Tax=Mesorhizobium sp. RMAD-H1 TaxID=2587065 RepID=UPI00161801EF|nr:hypothetical protein [Mesorhizobium sp. RMAD-H1]MBB2973672.1 hypothetical protein [Mesorhizobium sp. RMAD-H1]